MNPTTSPLARLAAPGAGLPLMERFIAKFMIHWKAARTSREQAEATFADEQAAIMRLLDGRDEVALGTAVLIKRIPGMEDSSRFWSLLMVVDHLRIVNREIAEVVACLGAGRVLEREASTAAVKPRRQVTKDVIAEFVQGCRDFSATVTALPDLKTKLKFSHPWFGPMDAAAWHFMAGFHMRLHRKQMNLILDGLSPKRS